MKLLPWVTALFLTTAFAQSQSDEPPTSPIQAQILGKILSGKKIESDPAHKVPNQDDQPLTAVIVTQCNQVVAVYFTMSSGKLLRFGKEAGVSAETLVDLAYKSAKYSERIEVSCNGLGETAREPHSRNDT
jgi:hypothetical protein